MYKKKGYNRMLVGDLYHWELDGNGNLLIGSNISAGKSRLG